MTKVPYVPASGEARSASLRPSGVQTVTRADGSILLQWPWDVFALQRGSAAADGAVNLQVPNIVDWLPVWAAARPNSIFMAERLIAGSAGKASTSGSSADWERLTYAQAWQQVQRIGSALLERQARLGGKQLVMAVLTGNSMRQALLTFAALYVGVAIAPISPGYATSGAGEGESARLRAVMEVLAPQLIYGEVLGPLRDALQALDVAPSSCISGADLDAWRQPGAPIDGIALTEAHAKASGDCIAKIMFTSGSTGIPKGVVMSHEMLASAQATSAANLMAMPTEPPVYLEWLPWHHVMGGNVNLNRLLRLGGTAWLDAGKPVPGRFSATIANLREIAPTFYFNVPLGYSMLVPALENDEVLARQFFSKLDYLSYGGAQIGVELVERIDRLSLKHTGRRIPVTSAYGATETSGPGLSTGPGMPSAGALGLPAPGVVAKLVKAGDRYELRLAGGNVRAQYLGLPEQSAAAVDEEGYYRTGDAVRWVDPADPLKGLEFAGRISEDFKLASGTWVNVGALRMRLVDALAPLVSDAVITGHNGEHIGALLFIDEARCRAAFPEAAALPRAELVRHAPLVREVARLLSACNAGQTGSSHRVMRALLLAEPPSPEAFEITDKGYLNQRAVLERRGAEVQRVSRAEPAADIAVSA